MEACSGRMGAKWWRNEFWCICLWPSTELGPSWSMGQLRQGNIQLMVLSLADILVKHYGFKYEWEEQTSPLESELNPRIQRGRIPLGCSYCTSHLCFQGPDSYHANSFPFQKEMDFLSWFSLTRLNHIQHCPYVFLLGTQFSEHGSKGLVVGLYVSGLLQL